MRTIPAAMRNLWEAGGPFVGSAGAPHSRVTVEKNWRLTRTWDIDTDKPGKLPFRWWQRIDNSQVETEVPNVKIVDIDRSLDADADSATISIYNQWMLGNTVAGQPGELGKPGYFTWSYGGRDARARWGQVPNVWEDVLKPNALLRTYQGYGGTDKTVSQAVADGNLILTGVWLVDEIRVGTDALLELRCRDMSKMLLEQQLYPPLMPAAVYPLHYYRWKYPTHTTKAVPYYDYTNPVDFGPGAEGPKYIPDIAISGDGKGYLLVGTDGGVFAFNTPYYGSRGDVTDSTPMMTIAADPLNRGYWIASSDGGVFAFGEVSYHGGMAGTPLSGPIIAMAAHKSGRGYWLLGDDGGVFAFGRATYHGDGTSTGRTFVDIAATPTGNGYWLLSSLGEIYAYGDAVWYGNFNVVGDPATGLAANPGGGYWIVTQNGSVGALGGAKVYPGRGDFGAATLADPIFAISASPSGHGYVLVGGDGGVFSFGDAVFRGSLPADFTTTTRVNGNYRDYVDIIKDLLRWSGWLAYGDGQDDVYGNLESTGAYAQDELPPDLFDKRPVIDAINTIKEIVGYQFWIDEEGAAHFEAPNWFEPGNFDESGNRLFVLPEIDEEKQLVDYTASYNDRSMRSEIIISSSDPEAGLQSTITTRHKISSDLLRGMVRPAMWVNAYFTKRQEQEFMAERIAEHIERSLRQGTVACVANLAIQVNDQVRIFERITGETFVHYVRGIHTHHDLDAGDFTMTLTTNWLGEDWDVEVTP